MGFKKRQLGEKWQPTIALVYATWEARQKTKSAADADAVQPPPPAPTPPVDAPAPPDQQKAAPEESTSKPEADVVVYSEIISFRVPTGFHRTTDVDLAESDAEQQCDDLEVAGYVEVGYARFTTSGRRFRIYAMPKK